MDALEFKSRAELKGVLVCPNTALARQFTAAIPDTRTLNIISDLTQYPPGQQLEARLRQLRPDVLLVDLSTDTETAIELIALVSSFKPTIYVVGLHDNNDAAVIIRSLRAGATEFLCAPFDLESLTTVITRILRLRESENQSAPDRGKVFAFVGAKAGQGATTLAYNTAFHCAQEGKAKVLLIDFDLTGGTISFALRVSHSYNVLDAIRHSEKLDKALWSALVNTREGLDVLLGPEKPELIGLEGHRIHEVVEYTRSLYDVVILDLPSAYDRISQATIGDADKVFLVCNPELPSLHLTRKCIFFLEQMGFGRDQFSLLLNRMSRKHELSPQDIEKVFNFPISRVFPEDYPAVHRALTGGKAIPPNCEFGRLLRDFGVSLVGTGRDDKKKGVAGLKLTALLSTGN